MKSILFKSVSIFGLALTTIACTPQTMNKEATTADQAETYTLIRDWKRVVRFDCKGEVTSDEIETVRAPNRYVSIAPKSSVNLYTSSFRNKTNNSHSPMVVGRDSFTIDMAPTTLNLKVEEGLNEIHYQFFYCDEMKKNEQGHETSECAYKPELREEGSLFIKVIYQQNWLSGVDEIKPSKEECEQSKK